jgi:hypothetical protein
VGKSNDASAPIGGVRSAFEVATSLEFAEQVVDSLLAETRQSRGFARAHAVDAGESQQRELGTGDVGITGCDQPLVHLVAMQLPHRP